MLSETLTAGLDEGSLNEFTDKLRNYVRERADQLAVALEPTWAQIDAEQLILENDLTSRCETAKATSAERIRRWLAQEDMTSMPPLERDIFALSNMTLGMDAGNAEYLGARVADDLFGSDPPFMLEGAGIEDEQMAQNLNRWFTDKALDPRGQFRTMASIVCDAAAAHPYAAARVRWGAYDPPSIEVDEDGSMIRPAYDKGLIFEALHHRDVLFDPQLPSKFDRQPFVALLMDMNRAELEGYLDKGLITEEDFQGLLGEMQASPRTMRTDKTTTLSTLDASVEGFLPCIEAYCSFPVPVSINGVTSTRVARLYVLISWQHKTIIFADMLSRVYPKGKVPVFLIAQEQSADALFRKGMLAKSGQASLILDTQLNSINFRSAMALNGPHFLNRGAIKELKDNQRPLPFIPGLLLTKEGNVPTSDILSPLTAAQPIEAIPQSIMEYVQQQSQLRTGVSGAAAGDVGALPQANTAAGVRQVLNHGSVLLKKPEASIRDCFAELLNMAALMAVDGMDQEEYYRFTDPQNGLVRLEKFQKPPNLDAIKFDVRLRISKVVAEERIQDGQAVLQVITTWLSFNDPTVEAAMMPVVSSTLAMIGMSNPMDTLVAINTARAAAYMRQMQAEAAQAEGTDGVDAGAKPQPDSANGG